MKKKKTTKKSIMSFFSHSIFIEIEFDDGFYLSYLKLNDL